MNYRVLGRVPFDKLCHSDKLKWGKVGIPKVLIFETNHKATAESTKANAIFNGYTDVHIEERE